LNELRQIGTTEGAYRYANPSEDSDILSSKINSIIEFIERQSTVPLEFVSDNLHVIARIQGTTKYWINTTNLDFSQSYIISIKIFDEIIDLPVEIIDVYDASDNDDKLWELWYSYLVDQIADEILNLSKLNPEELSRIDNKLHIELLNQRSKSILVRLNSESDNYRRFQTLMTTLKSITMGETVDKLKLSDMKFEGTFATKTSQTSKTSQSFRPAIMFSSSSNEPDKLDEPTSSRTSPRNDSWQVIRASISDLRQFDKSKSIANVLWLCRQNKVIHPLNQFLSDLNGDYSDIVNYPSIIEATRLGRYEVLRMLLDLKLWDVNTQDSHGFNAMDYAILYGYYTTYTILKSYGARPSANGRSLLQTCLNRHYTVTAQHLVDDEIVEITIDMIDYAPNTTIKLWLQSKMKALGLIICSKTIF